MLKRLKAACYALLNVNALYWWNLVVCIVACAEELSLTLLLMLQAWQKNPAIQFVFAADEEHSSGRRTDPGRTVIRLQTLMCSCMDLMNMMILRLMHTLLQISESRKNNMTYNAIMIISECWQTIVRMRCMSTVSDASLRTVGQTCGLFWTPCVSIC